MASKFLLSTTETGKTVHGMFRPGLSELLGDDAMLSTIPESKGADVLLYTELGLIGWQRKEVPYDFISSFTDGRLTRSIALMKTSCVFQRIIGEGEFKYYPDTTVNMGRYKGGIPIKTRFTKRHVRGMINDVEFVHGIPIDWTDDIADTVDYLRSVRYFFSDPKHLGLYRRPSAKGAWVVPSSNDIYLWVLQSFPGIGPSTADMIVQAFGGKVPIRWTCTVEELARVPRISLSKARELVGYLPTQEPTFTGAVMKRSRAMAEAFKAVYSPGPEFDSMRNRLRKLSA